jgi:di/tricarboxylate transporter
LIARSMNVGELLVVWQPWLVLASVGLLLGLLVHGRTTPVVLFGTWAVAFFVLGWVPQATFLGGYTSTALVILLVLLLVSLALERSPWMSRLSSQVVSGSERQAVWRLTSLAALLSAFLNNTAVVSGLLGSVARQQRMASSRLLIPLSYASILGGITTLVGTSTNLVVSSLAVQAGLPALTMFQFAWVGVPVAVLCLLVLVWRSRSLPSHPMQQRETQSYFLETQVLLGSTLVGRTIETNGLRQLDGLFLLEIVREQRLLSPVSPEELVQADDHLIFTGELSKVQALQKFDGLQVFGGAQAHELLTSNLMEVVLTQQSELVNKTLREVDFRNLFDAGVVGIRRGERRLAGQLGRIELKVGDSLLLAVGPEFKQRKNLDRNFHVLTETPLRPTLKPWENRVAVFGFVAVIGGAALGVFALLQGLLVLLGVLLATQILSPGELRRRFPFDLWILIGSALTIAAGLEASGASALIAQGIAFAFGGYGVWVALLGVYVMTWLLTELVTNNAAAALAFPVAIATAQAFDVEPMAFVMVVAYAASACFLMPFGYQTHLMVYSAGRYSALDYLKTGWPVSLAYAAGVLVLTPMVFPLLSAAQ